jgi:CheY-like chemotaxis protein
LTTGGIVVKRCICSVVFEILTPPLLQPSFLDMCIKAKKGNCYYYLSLCKEKARPIKFAITPPSRKKYDMSVNSKNNNVVRSITRDDSISSQSLPVSDTNRILIIDDEPDLSKLFRLGLQGAGFTVDIFNDPIAALNNYKTGFYDLVLLDVRMPKMDGFELYRNIRNKDDKVKVCFISAFEEYYSKFRDLFPDMRKDECFISKPVPLEELVNIIKSRLNQAT